MTVSATPFFLVFPHFPPTAFPPSPSSASSSCPLSPPFSFSIPVSHCPLVPYPLSPCPIVLPSPSPPNPSPDSFTCRQFPRNPCAPGVCIDDVDGTYSCLCPSPYFPFYLYPKGAARCYHLRLAETRMPTFLSPYGLTCPLILNTYGLTQKDFFSQNKGFQCRAPIPVGTLVNVTSRAFSQCTAMYTANYGDTCDSLNALFSTQILPLNPALTCSDGPRPGQVSIGAGGCKWVQVSLGPADLPAAVAGVCHRLPHALLPDESRPLVRLAAATQPPAGQHDEKGELGWEGESRGVVRVSCEMREEQEV
ncbi:unnamed protein product [Closterium sp. NIES-65]|nr:unnamed protein product [Closterium sp. NIES-65]